MQFEKEIGFHPNLQFLTIIHVFTFRIQRTPMLGHDYMEKPKPPMAVFSVSVRLSSNDQKSPAIVKIQDLAMSSFIT